MALGSRNKNSNLGKLHILRARIEHSIRSYRGWYILQGILFICFGLIAAILPSVTALSAALFIGALLLVSGIFQILASSIAGMHWWAFLSALLSIIIGGWMLWMPLAGLMAIVIAVAVFFAIEGALEIMLALEFRPVQNWGWMLVSGIATLLLSILLFSGFPGWSIFYLGLLIAINFVFYGISLLMLVWSIS